MGMNETPSGERIHIGFFGRRNAGKSSLVNAVTGSGSGGGVRCAWHDDRSGDKGYGVVAYGTGGDY